MTLAQMLFQDLVPLMAGYLILLFSLRIFILPLADLKGPTFSVYERFHFCSHAHKSSLHIVQFEVMYHRNKQPKLFLLKLYPFYNICISTGSIPSDEFCMLHVVLVAQYHPCIIY